MTSTRIPSAAVNAPLLRIATKKVTTAINPEFEVNGERLTLEPFQTAFLPTRLLKRPAGSLAGERHAIVHAIDALLTGL